ncbi:DNAJ-like protein SUBFAMILY B MEMBER 6-LIKE [Salix koriyanagi]|uniref:DNAJ-like protein SUBFAMILY B MEMBER 6-LIKE n=1 Tax=Salix koriyanagi TaxID=2511006 RepID=A0A9Q0Z6Q9_9ROSI|nr:DNAJ-like protein SUBFAMILY B MEMBER 6-LIKE [Salix koriyanagi]
MSEVGSCYYSVLGLCKQASDSEIRDAYRKLALKWHPDRWLKDQVAAGQAKRQFQQIQEAYSVLSDKGKKRIYDAGMLGFLGDDDDEGFCDFMQEMILMMENVRSKVTSNSCLMTIY